MRIDILTLFPEMFRGPFGESILKRAADAGLLNLGIHDIRTFATDRHHTADDAPFGGGAGQVLKAPPIVEAIEQILVGSASDTQDTPDIIVMAAQGRPFTQRVAQEL